MRLSGVITVSKSDFTSVTFEEMDSSLLEKRGKVRVRSKFTYMPGNNLSRAILL